MTREVLSEFSESIGEKECDPFSRMLKAGVDLGTADIIATVMGESNHPIIGTTAVFKVVRDDIMADFIGAMQTVHHLKVQLEELLGVPLEAATTAVPPGIIEGNIGCIANVVEGTGFEVIHAVGEPTAAASVLKIRNGTVMNVDNGTTGVNMLEDREVIFIVDEPTGGTHMILILAGYYGISIEEAEKLKTDKDRERNVFPIIRLVVEKMTSIVRGFFSGYEADCVYVVGRAGCFNESEHIFEKALDIRTVKMNNALSITPLDIVWNTPAGPV